MHNFQLGTLLSSEVIAMYSYLLQANSEIKPVLVISSHYQYWPYWPKSETNIAVENLEISLGIIVNGFSALVRSLNNKQACFMYYGTWYIN
jgi:hypothetical protein